MYSFTVHLYTKGDVTRMKKLLKQQKLGKARMKTLGNVTLTQNAFLAVTKR